MSPPPPGLRRGVRAACVAIVAASLLPAAAASAQTASRVIRQIDQRCASCHTNPDAERPPDVAGARPVTALRRLSAEALFQSMTTGSMRAHADGLTDEVKRAMAEFLSGRKLGMTDAAEARRMPNQCRTNPPIGSVTAAPVWNGWSPEPTNARFQKSPGITAGDVPRLTLKWAFGFPGVTSVYGQPTMVAGRVFVGVDTGFVYSLDAATGCVYWSFQAEAGVRNAVTVGPIGGARPATAAYFGDVRGNVYAVNAATGAPLWKVAADTHPLAVITGAPALHDGRLYVPVSSREEGPGGSQFYPCCTFRGSIVSLDAHTGRQIWKTHAIPTPPARAKKNSAGTQLWSPAGAAIWHTPTIDPRSRAIYVATGDAYTLPAPNTTDAVMALDMDTGTVRWSVQDTENDAWLVGCLGQERLENCPADLGPDFDFGSPPILHTLPDGRRVLMAGQKSGEVFAHDPDRQGAVVWKTSLVEKVGAAEILFGGAADERSAYFGLSNGVLAAVDPVTGAPRWSVPLSQGQRRGLTAALTAIPGVVFAGGQDGVIRAVDSGTGTVVWQFNMLQDFTTVNGVAAKGGGMGAPGPTVAGGTLLVGSGYVGLGNGTPGNVLLAFTASGARAAADADRQWTAALQANDVAAARTMLDPEFRWTNAEGLTRDRSESMASAAALAAELHGEAAVQTYDYGHVTVITSERQSTRLMRVWALRPEGWRVFSVIATEQATGSTPFAASGGEEIGDCDNPCRTMPFTPRTANETSIAGIFQQLKMDEWKPNPINWAPYVVDDVYYVTATARLSKGDRVARLAQLKQTGAPSVPGDPVVSMAITEFGDAAVMTARHTPYRGGRPYYSVRVWALRDGRWQLANTQQTTIGASTDEQAVVQADGRLLTALEKADKASLDQLMDPDFSWVTPAGVMRPRNSILAATPKPAIASGSGAEVTARTLGSRIVVVQYHSGKTHAMHVWVKRATDWRLLHINEVTEGARVVYAGTTLGGAECINPCKVVPFVPGTPNEKAVMESWQAQQSSPALWAQHIPDDNVARTSNGTYTKADRIAVQQEQTRAGTKAAAGPLTYARIWEFGDSALMLALQPRAVGKPFWGSRVFELRNGVWMMAESYQTTIQDF